MLQTLKGEEDSRKNKEKKRKGSALQANGQNSIKKSFIDEGAHYLNKLTEGKITEIYVGLEINGADQTNPDVARRN
jgi:hypothetical protein